jgi:hypothetical protein
MQPEIISESFRIHYPDGTSEDFMKTDTSEFRWSLTPSGDLLVFYVEKHKLFSSAIIKDERRFALARGSWSKVEVLETEVVEEETPDEAGSIIVND